MFDNIRFNFLYIDTYSFGKNWVYPESIVPYNMLRYIKFGSGTFFIDDEEFVVSKSQIVYIPKGSFHVILQVKIFRLQVYGLQTRYILKVEIF